MRNMLQLIFLGFFYVIVSLVVGEVHPFTVVPMYSGFPNYAYSFYLSDSHANVLPSAKYFECKEDYLSHVYGSICDQKGINAGKEKETGIELAVVGKEMLEAIQKRKIATLPRGVVELHRVCFFMENDSIKKIDKKMYEAIITN